MCRVTRCEREKIMTNFKILVVEDSPLMRQLITVSLKRFQGADIVEAEDGVVGLKKLKSETFDLVILDINMPIMNGLKLIGHIRSDDTLKALPIMVVTTEGVEEDKARALELGADVYLTKPVDGRDILATAKKLLGAGG